MHDALQGVQYEEYYMLGDMDVTMASERERTSFGKSAKLGIEIGVVLAVLLLQFRLLTICIVGVLVLLFIFFPRCRNRRWLFPAGVVALISMFLPFDVALGSFHYGSHEGTSPGGPHFVHFVVGMPMHTRLIERYGEYISGGCTWSVVYPPRTILVWN
jgi:hypothetical protein